MGRFDTGTKIWPPIEERYPITVIFGLGMRPQTKRKRNPKIVNVRFITVSLLFLWGRDHAETAYIYDMAAR